MTVHVFVVAPALAVIVVKVEVSTPEVAMANVAEFEPAGTVTDAGTVTHD